MMSGSPAVVRVAIAPLLADPRVASAQVSQILAGHVVDILERCDEWMRVRGEDDYEGWMHRGYLQSLDDVSRDSSSARMPTILSLGCVGERPNGQRVPLPLGAFVDPSLRVIQGEAIPLDEAQRRFMPTGSAICESARRLFMGTSYQWGGVTPWGADCSGLAQSVFRLHSVSLPRDAWQQAQAGHEAPSDVDSLIAGDLLFFSDRDDRKITHVGIALGDSGMVHLALGRGGYAVENLRDRSDAYVGKLLERFQHARRVLD